MTRKQALYRALQVLEEPEAISKINEIFDDMPFTGWSENTIFDTIDQFILDNGRVPIATDFRKKGLPPHPVIKLRFGITLREFLDKYYPVEKLCKSKDYYNKTKEEWQAIFIKTYLEHKPHSAEKYNAVKPKDIPGWATTAKMFDIKTWVNWMKFCKLEQYLITTSHSRNRKNHDLIVIPTIDLLIELQSEKFQNIE